jgi:hypothetical protein
MRVYSPVQPGVQVMYNAVIIRLFDGLNADLYITRIVNPAHLRTHGVDGTAPLFEKGAFQVGAELLFIGELAQIFRVLCNLLS